LFGRILGAAGDRHIDIFRVNGCLLQLSEQVVRRGLERIHLAVARHGARVIERKCHTQARIAPRRDRQGTDLDLWLTPIMPRKFVWTTAAPLRVSFDPPPDVNSARW